MESEGRIRKLRHENVAIEGLIEELMRGHVPRKNGVMPHDFARKSDTEIVSYGTYF